MQDFSHHRPAAFAIATLVVVALTSCGNSDPAIGKAGASGTATSAVASAPAPKPMELPMSAKDCGSTNLSHSLCAIRAMLDDVEKETGEGAGGGITAISAKSSHAFSITLGMEERSVTYHYDFDFEASPPKIKSRTETVETFGQ